MSRRARKPENTPTEYSLDSTETGGTVTEPNTESTESGESTGDSFVSPSTAESSSSESSTSSGSSSNRMSTSRSKSNSKRTSPKTARERQQQKEKGSQNLETLLLSTHTMLALISKTPELQLTKDESTKLAEAINEVNALYDFSVLPP